LTVIKNHAKSSKHGVKVKAIPKTTITSIFKKAETSVETQKKAELKLTGFLTEHNISFNCVDHLTKVLKECFPDSKIAQEMSLGRTKATQITRNVLGTCSENDIVTLLRNNKFSLIIDESTDIASLKTLCVCVRFFHPEMGKVLTLFWKLIQIFSGDEPDKAHEGATADRLFNEIQSALSSSDIPLKNLVGFASDGCNTMFGRVNSVASKLISANPGIIVQKCICHSLHLCASEACKCLPRLCEDLARNIYSFFKNSAKRQAMLKEFQIFCNVDPHKILRPAQTRWLSLLSVVRRILEQWEPLKLFFTENYMEHRLLASEEIYNALNNLEIKLFFIFLNWVLPKFVDLNKYFQSEKVVILNLHEKMADTYKDLLLSYMQPNYVRQTDIENIDPANNSQFTPYENMYLGVGIMQNINSLTDPVAKQDFYERCRRFLITSCLEIKKRYNFKDPVLSKMHVLSKPNIKKTDTLFSLMTSVPLICDPKNVQEFQKIDDQWRNLKSFENLPETDEIDEFYFALSKITGFAGEPLFPDLSKFAMNVLSLPHSSASCERVFSKVNLIKTKSRNKLLTSTLNGILLSSQRMNLENGCVNFKPTNKMVQVV
jgi:hypothetical protein